ncbi:E3 ubiquitin-protein ligase RAD18-like [Osmia bicornis bicornis]|uniref:E3 ubiquitin-protein ligase RAD18-like n=1 Tax=Osmia bicornis bicornis TaxID=1437191 RepID=UPI001EAF4CCF|nr:E3 ubiquitin-protein ligase RAD18-like [Osmia bicornis bicornis]
MWPQEYIELKHIDNLLVCGICYEYMDTSVITACSHNYCSLCIRKYLHYKTQCPACFTETFEKDLRKNKVLDEIIAQFVKVKDKLKICVRNQVMLKHNNEVEENVLNTPKLMRQYKDVNINSQERNILNNSLKSINNTSPSVSVQKDTCGPSTSGKPRIPLMFTPKCYKSSSVTNMEETKVVICPVCKVSISEVKINRHLDDCLKREAVKGKPQIEEPKREPLPKLVFSLMKDAMLRKKLKEFGLSTHGDRKTMEARLQRYIVLYNAECDKPNPRSVLELVKQCDDEENLEKKINKTSLFLNKLQINRNTEQNIIEDERKKYLEAHKNSFENLIKKIKDTEPPKKSSARRSLLREYVDDNKDIPQETEAEDLDDSMINIAQNDLQSLNSVGYIQDSDSDTSCPLQMYSNSDPRKFLNVEFPSASDNNNVSQNQSELNSDEYIVKNESNVSPMKTSSLSEVFSDNSMPNEEMHSTMETSFSKLMSKTDSKNSPNASPYKKLLQRKGKSVNDQMNQAHSVISDKDEIENDKSSLNVQDLSSNDSIDSKFNYGRRRIIRGLANNSAANLLNLEKRNVGMLPECGGRCLRSKRNCDTLQTDNQIVSNKKKRAKKSCNKERSISAARDL